jgi:hypothetical protein
MNVRDPAFRHRRCIVPTVQEVIVLSVLRLRLCAATAILGRPRRSRKSSKRSNQPTKLGAPISRSVSMARVAADSSSSRCLQPRCPSSRSSGALGSQKVGYAVQRSSHPSGSRRTRREARRPWLPSSPRKPSVPHRVHSAQPDTPAAQLCGFIPAMIQPHVARGAGAAKLFDWRDRCRRAINSVALCQPPNGTAGTVPCIGSIPRCWLLFAQRHPKARAASNARPSFIT